MAKAGEEADLVIQGGAGSSWSEIRPGQNTKIFQGALW